MTEGPFRKVFPYAQKSGDLNRSEPSPFDATVLEPHRQMIRLAVALSSGVSTFIDEAPRLRSGSPEATGL